MKWQFMSVAHFSNEFLLFSIDYYIFFKYLPPVWGFSLCGVFYYFFKFLIQGFIILREEQSNIR